MRSFAYGAPMFTLIVTLATIANAAVTIESFDGNGDGFADLAEIRAKFPGFSDLSFEAIDSNDDNRLDSEEVIAPQAQTEFARYAATEDRDRSSYDQDGDGFIQPAELAAVFPDFDMEDFQDADANDDNRLDFTEYNSTTFSAAIDRYGSDSVTDISDLDIDQNSFASLDEMRRVYPQLSDIDFNNIDTNDDGRLSSQEIYTSDAQVILSRSQ